MYASQACNYQISTLDTIHFLEDKKKCERGNWYELVLNYLLERNQGYMVHSNPLCPTFGKHGLFATQNAQSSFLYLNWNIVE